MKFLPAVLLFVCLTLGYSCQKSSVKPVVNAPDTVKDADTTVVMQNPTETNRPFAGNWQLVNDSTHYDGGELPANAKSTNYAGQPGDHYNFSKNGKVYITEGKITDTVDYTVSTDNKIVFNYPNYMVNNGQPVALSFTKTTLTATTFTLSSDLVSTMGVFKVIINLKK